MLLPEVSSFTFTDWAVNNQPTSQQPLDPIYLSPLSRGWLRGRNHFLSGITKTLAIVSFDWVHDLPCFVGRFTYTVPCLANIKRTLLLCGSNPLNQYLLPCPFVYWHSLLIQYGISKVREQQEPGDGNYPDGILIELRFTEKKYSLPWWTPVLGKRWHKRNIGNQLKFSPEQQREVGHG